ncbi:MAG: S46 family peptidase [Bacteroidota bacterium]|nr:S46 family peptidase [Bacteroidota bacterium]
MKNRVFRLALPFVIFLLFSGLTFPDEGMWMLNQLGKLPISDMQKNGLQIPLEGIYNPDGTSLKDAIVLLGGGTSSFISAEGLILTNHHVAFGAIQSVSSVEEDRLKDGFLANTKEEEISIPSYNAQVVVSITDVTTEVLGAVNDTMSTDSRAKAIQSKMREIEKREKGDTEYEFRISEFYNGVKYFMYKYEVFKDVRLVYAPPTSIGNYGGEVDNWYWPRHTGDFALMRVYIAPDGKHAKYSKENVPYKPKVYLPISTQGYTENSFAMILGFPGRTFRYRTSPEILLAKDETLPLNMELFKMRMDIIEAAGKNDRATEIKYAGRWRGMANAYKNYQGTLEGMRRADILKLRKEEETKFSEFLSTDPELENKYGTVLSDIATLFDDLKTFNQKQIIMSQLMGSSDVLSLSNRFRNFAKSFTKDSTGEIKPPTAMYNELKDAFPNTYKNTNFVVDKDVLTAMILKAAELPPDQQIKIIQKIIGNKTGEKRNCAVREFVDDLYDDTKLLTTEGCLKLLSKDADDILDDEFVRFSNELDKDFSQIMPKSSAFNAKIGLLRSKLLEAHMAWKGFDIYPDANRTLRLTHGVIKSYNPRDAVHYDYQTLLGGIMEKETGEDPFIVPQKLQQLWETKDFGKYADPRLNDVPVAFIANLDITGGNSGSPVINGKGELIGLAFDGNWEAVVGDYVYQEPFNRSINVDSRYILFVLDKFSNAQNILNELTIK